MSNIKCQIDNMKFHNATFVVSLITLIILITLIVYIYNEWCRVMATAKEIKNKFISVIPKIHSGCYTKIAYPSTIKSKYSRLSLDPKKFDKEVAHLLSSCILSSYNESSGFSALLPSYAKLLRRLGSTGYLYQLDEHLYVLAYRGTLSGEDVATDLDFSQTHMVGNSFISNNENNVLVHRGFYNLWQKQKDDLEKLVSQFTKSDIVYVTGHSLGAAIASFSALDLAHGVVEGCSVACYLFAPPRTGNDMFTSLLNEKVPHCWSIVNKTDLIPYLPPSCFTSYDGLWIYDNFVKIVYIDIQTGVITGNHHVDTYIYGLNCKGSIKPKIVYWNRVNNQ